jgi:hypothetical protein
MNVLEDITFWFEFGRLPITLTIISLENYISFWETFYEE